MDFVASPLTKTARNSFLTQIPIPVSVDLTRNHIITSSVRFTAEIVSNMRILVLEDKNSQAQKNCALLSSIGFEIVDKRSFVDTITSFADIAIDAVLIDISRKDCTGLEEFTKLQELNPKLSFIVLSVHDGQDIALEFIKRGAQDYLVKGFVGANSLIRCLMYGVERSKVALDQRLREERMKLVLEDSYDAFI